MKCYIYAADTYCEKCGESIRSKLHKHGEAPANPDDEHYDSGVYPKGPFDVEASDTPEHCGSGSDCLEPTVIAGRPYGLFLENPLTRDGEAYVKDADDGSVADFWKAHYGL